MASFAELLTLYMKDIRISVASLAEKITSASNPRKDEPGVSSITISRWKNGTVIKGRIQIPHKREYILDLIKPLLLDMNQSNQLLKAAEYKTLVDEERQKYFPNSKIELQPRSQNEESLRNSFQLQTEKNDNWCSYEEKSTNDDLVGDIFKDYIQELFKKLSQTHPYPIMLLLTQTFWDELPCRKAILLKAEKIYSPENVLHIKPPYSSSEDENEYFADLGQQCGECVKDGYGFEKWLKQRLKVTYPLFLLVSRFEQGASSLNKHLAGIIRNISEDTPNRLHVILWGGKKLADLKYQEGDLSLLNFAEVEYWPELGLEEIKARGKQHFGLQIDEVLAEKLLTICGGHPQLLHECLKLRSDKTTLESNNYMEKLIQCDTIWQSFQPFEKMPEDRQTICEWLKKGTQEKVAKWQPYIQNDLLRKLFWKNLLVRQDNNGESGLYWRGEVILWAGKKILGCSFSAYYPGQSTTTPQKSTKDVIDENRDIDIGNNAPAVPIINIPINHPCQFFGREKELKRIFKRWEHLPLHHLAVIGERHSGKTSLLHYVKNIHTAKQKRAGQRQDWLPPNYQFVLVDFQAAGMREEERLLSYILQTLNLTVPNPCHLPDFTDVMRSELYNPTVLLMDRIDVGLQAPALNYQFWWGIRSLVINQMNGKLGLLVASPQLPTELIPKNGDNQPSPFLNIFAETVKLGPFTENEARELLKCSPQPFAEADVEWILEKSSRCPALVQILCDVRLTTLEEGETGEEWKEKGLVRLEDYQ
jgi:hypothetical protein